MLYFSCGKRAYRNLHSLLDLPSEKTILRLLKNYNITSGINPLLVSMVKHKFKLSNRNKYCFILMDEMAIRKGFAYNKNLDKITGLANSSNNSSLRPATSALVIMLRGIVEKWKQPIGYYLTEGVAPTPLLKELLQDAIQKAEMEGFEVLGITTDMGSNFEKLFKELGVMTEKPIITIFDKEYLIYRDPPHLIKCARNFLEKHEVKLPNNNTAKWSHITNFFSSNRKNSMLLAPKLTDHHLFNIKFQNRMKVKLAVQVLSNTVSSALDFYVSQNLIQSSAIGTSMYCKSINDAFDILNSTHSGEKVPLRRPLQGTSIGTINRLNELIDWFRELQNLNSDKRVKFIKGFIQSLTVLKILLNKLPDYELKYLSTRSLCQDPLENFFGQVRAKQKFPNSCQFVYNFKNISLSFLSMPSGKGNCEEETADECAVDYKGLLNLVSFIMSL